MPYAKTGGLADVAAALLQELKRLGHDVRAFMPLYASVRSAHPELQPVLGLQNVGLSIGASHYSFSIRTASFPNTDIAMYFIDCPPLYDRPTLYTESGDEHRRFLLFTRAAIESCQRLNFVPDIFHCNDWHTAFLPLYLKTVYASIPAFAHGRSVLTVHNIGYQGVMPSAAVDDLGLGPAARQLDAADYAAGVINPLKTGIKYADVVTTVSPTYAREICETDLGMGMQQTLAARSQGVIGILNGVDYREWDPRHDPYLAVHFAPDDLRGKRANKQRLLAAVGADIDPDVPLIGMVTRLAEQKGIDLLMQALPRALDERNFGFTILGNGDARFASFFADLARRFPSRVSFHGGYDETLAHLIEAGSDMFLMPSRYEPCGLNQMYSLRYGTIPIVRRTGGLADSVRHFDPATGLGTGCMFNDYDAAAVRWGIDTALGWFADRAAWQRLTQNAMAEDFSWGRQSLQYERLYRDAMSRPPNKA